MKVRKFKYKYYRLPPCDKAIADIGCYVGFKNSENIIVREKIDLDEGIFSNNGTSEYTFVEFAGDGINETIDGVNLYGNGSLYIKREDLRPIFSFGKPEEKFQKQIKEYVQSKKYCNETKEIPLSLEAKLKTAIEGLERAAGFLTCMDDLTELTGKCNEQLALEAINNALEKIKENK